MLYQLPTTEDKQAIETAVSVFLWTQKASTRDLMLRAIQTVLEKYNITKLNLTNYAVTMLKPKNVAVFGKYEITGSECPECGEFIYDSSGKVKIISINERIRRDIVTFGCKCGNVFRKREVNQEKKGGRLHDQ